MSAQLADGCSCPTEESYLMKMSGTATSLEDAEALGDKEEQ
jgi:hypothetical protein